MRGQVAEFAVACLLSVLRNEPADYAASAAARCPALVPALRQRLRVVTEVPRPLLASRPPR